MVLYEGGCDPLVEVACNGDATGQSGCQSYYSAIVNHPVTAGTTYLIRLGGYNGATGMGTLSVQYISATAEGACCLPDGSCYPTPLTYDGCVTTLGGTWAYDLTCADVDCPQPYTTCSGIDESSLIGGNGYACVCPSDGFDSESDCNGGGNSVDLSYTAYTLGSTICGQASVYVDGPTGLTYRDTDWYTNAEIAPGGDMTLTIGSPATMLLLVIDNISGEGLQLGNPAGYTVSASANVAAGDNILIALPSEWNVAWSCGSGDEVYTMSVDLVTP
jgi:hypothetical protein